MVFPLFHQHINRETLFKPKDKQLSSWVIRLESERESRPTLTSHIQVPPLTQIGLQSHKHTAGQKSNPIIATRNAAWSRTGPGTEDRMAGKHSTSCTEARQHLQSIVVLLSSCSFHTGLNRRYGTLTPQRQSMLSRHKSMVCF